MASEVKKYFLELAGKKRLAYMEEHGIDFIEFLQMEAEDKFEYELTFKVTVHDTKEQRFVFMKGNFFRYVYINK